MKRKAIFIDKDGTLVHDVPYNADPRLIVLEEGVIEGLKKLSGDNYLHIIVTNQSGIAHGYFTEKDLLCVKEHLSQLLMKDSIVLDDFYYCPHLPDASLKEYDVSCTCRKPLPGLLLQAAADYDIDLLQSWMIGDILNDVEAGARAGCKTILIDNGNETEWIMDSPVRIPYFIANDMREAADFILSETHQTKY